MSDTPLMTRSEIRVEAWRKVLEKTDRILSEQPVTVSVVDADAGNMAGVPAWSDGCNIHLNGKMLKEVMGKRDPLAAVLRLKGLNYHELCHVLFTPRMTDEFPRRVIARATDTGDKTWWYAFNALEDQRIETWFASIYGASRRYFESIILEWIIREGNAEAAILVYGRKYLTPRIRVQAGRVFTKKYGKPLYDEFKTVIDEYVTLELPTQSVKAMTLLIKFHELLKKMQGAHQAPLPPLVIMDNGMQDGVPQRSTEGAARTGRVLIKQARRAQQKAQDVIDDAIDADIEEEERRDNGGSLNDGAEGSDGEAIDATPQSGGKAAKDGKSGKSQQGSSGPEGGADASSDGGSQGDASDAAPGGGGAGSSGTAQHTRSQGEVDQDRSVKDEWDDLIDAAHDQMDDVRADEQVQEDAERVFDAIRAAEQAGQADAMGESLRRAGSKPPSPEAVLAARKVQHHLTRIRQEAEPETLRRQHHGRVDVRRVISRQPHEVDVFTNWDTGQEEETGVEVVLQVDVSGSMQGYTEQVSEATWALKRAFDKLDIRTTVLLFDTHHKVVWQPADRAHPGKVPQMYSGGGTDPTSSYEQAARVLATSQKPNKVLITLTDGSWSGDEQKRLRMLKHLHKQGVITMLLGFGRAYEAYGKHGHLQGHDIARLNELPKMAAKLVSEIMRNATWSA